MKPLAQVIADHGGTVTHSGNTKAVDFPEDPYEEVVAKIAAHEAAQQAGFEAALARAREYGTRVAPLRGERGDGWYVATSHSHPGEGYRVQVDVEEGAVRQCHCDYGQVNLGGWCHHGAAALAAAQQQAHKEVMEKVS